MKPDPAIEEILDFWFEGRTDRDVIRADQPPAKKWFAADPAFDREVRERFEARLTSAREGSCAAWEGEVRGRLALILLFDQFTRNIYRGTSRMFADDPAAQRLALRTVDADWDRDLSLLERVFMYMPLMHAEDPRLQDRSVRYFERLVEESRIRCPRNTVYFEQSQLKHARKHRDEIDRFGRFPSRNRILGRMSTAAEEAWLEA